MKSQGYTLPTNSLTQFVERFWWSDITAGTPILPMNPATGSELLFYFSTPLTYSTEERSATSPFVALVRVTKGRLLLSAEVNTSLLAVRFRTGMLRHFLPQRAICNLDPVVDAKLIWGDAISRLYEMVLSAENRSEAVPAIECFLLKLLTSYHCSDVEIDRLALLLYYRSMGVSVQDLAHKIGYSRRQLQRICTNNFGISTKHYISTIRINQVKKKMLFTNDDHYLSHALDSGYFDQAHFIHEFKNVVSVTPTEFMRNFRKMSHFYNTSLPSSAYFASTVN